jgi:hypothetical protein
VASQPPIQETLLTPELAARLLGTPYDRQRRLSRQTVSDYERQIRDGAWRLVPDPIMVDPEGRMFNGLHRCTAVINTRTPIPVYIQWDADPTLFDVIDTGRGRSAYQFVPEKQASLRASGARVTLWYAKNFSKPLGSTTIKFTNHEILAEAARLKDTFDTVLPLARATYNYTSISQAVCVGAFALAEAEGLHAEVVEFVEGIVDSNDLADNDPARVLADRFRRQSHRTKRRPLIEDWTLLVHALNLRTEGLTASPQILTTSAVWPRVGEREREYKRRQQAVAQARYRTKAA